MPDVSQPSSHSQAIVHGYEYLGHSQALVQSVSTRAIGPRRQYAGHRAEDTHQPPAKPKDKAKAPARVARPLDYVS